MENLEQTQSVEGSWAAEFAKRIRDSDSFGDAMASFMSQAESLDPVRSAGALAKEGVVPLYEIAAAIFNFARQEAPEPRDVFLTESAMFAWAAALAGAAIAADALGILGSESSALGSERKTNLLWRQIILLGFLSGEGGGFDSEGSRIMAGAMAQAGMDLPLLEKWIGGADGVGCLLRDQLSEMGAGALAEWSRAELCESAVPAGARRRASL